jgi:hypothetical protein
MPLFCVEFSLYCREFLTEDEKGMKESLEVA